ncbi:MAG: helix-turn-helix domain-containing protein [Patescibacteria group bacterium]|nr:helix-turn-helix domain-containing protein [Patescibacteria group bacterium]
MKSESTKLGKNLKRIRTEKGITQGDIDGRMNPTLSTLEKISNALRISSSELLK